MAAEKAKQQSNARNHNLTQQEPIAKSHPKSYDEEQPSGRTRSFRKIRTQGYKSDANTLLY